MSTTKTQTTHIVYLQSTLNTTGSRILDDEMKNVQRLNVSKLKMFDHPKHFVHFFQPEKQIQPNIWKCRTLQTRALGNGTYKSVFCLLHGCQHQHITMTHLKTIVMFL